MKIMTLTPRPKPPTFKLNEQQTYVDPDHPDYVEEKQNWRVQYSDQLLNTILLFGVEIKKIPRGVEKPSDDGWVRKLELAGLETLPDNEDWRLLMWVQTVAAPQEDDLGLITEEVNRLSGVAESDAEAAAEFPGS
jgi:hypothetical protein